MTVNRFAAVIAALGLIPAAAASAAAAGNPHDQTQPSASVTTLVSGPTPIKAKDIPDAPGGLKAGKAGASALAGDCGACLVYCWGATTRSGPSDWSGSVFIYQHLYWCGNGAKVTYGSAWQSYSQSGSYRLDQTYGPWWSGGCIGCSSLRASGYILWNWNAPLISIPQSGTSHLDTTMYAWGVLSY
ncbi:MAG TPA: hypothetical protein VHQ89_05995 [Gaiellaceae bacterium]|jgi:hypothetical protein|nr:hypothetical protein [Gaiellaceae bacterium]